MDNKVDWKKELDPRKYCFGHSLYRRLVSTVTSYRLRIQGDEEKLAEADKTMDLLSATVFTSQGGHVEVFEFALDQDVLVANRDNSAQVPCKIIGQLMMNIEGGAVEFYLTNKHGAIWQDPEYITEKLEEECNTVKDVSDETDSNKV
jgi:hypothetical protein